MRGVAPESSPRRVRYNLPMAAFCSNCGAQGTGRFCGSCGAAFPVQPSPPPPQPFQPQPYQVQPNPYPVGPAPSGGSQVAKILMIIAVAIFVLGGLGVAGIAYLG